MMKPFVLVVDDSLTVRLDLRQALGNANFAVTACGTLTTARQVLRSRGCDLAILDIMLPDGNGTDLLREIKEDPELCHIPVIVISGGVVTTAEAGESAPRGASSTPLSAQAADGYLSKPFDPRSIVRLAEDLCTANLGGKRFLLVDDSPTFVHALGSLLRQQGNEVVCAQTGEEALQRLQQEHFDCVILDMVMPGIGGLETCRRVRQITGLAELPVVMLTANENTSGRSQGVAIGADEFLLKSHRFERLVAQIRSLLRRKQKTGRDSSPRVPAASMHEQVLALIGMTQSVARMVLTRACRAVGVDPTAVTVMALPRLMPALRDNLGMFLAPQQLAQRLEAIRALAERPELRDTRSVSSPSVTPEPAPSASS